MVFHYQISLYTILWLTVWCILRLLDLILLMLFMLSINLLSLPLQFIGQQFSIFVVISKDLNFRVFSFPHCFSLELFAYYADQASDPTYCKSTTLFCIFLKVLLSLGKERNKTLSLAFLQKLNIVICQMSSTTNEIIWMC